MWEVVLYGFSPRRHAYLCADFWQACSVAAQLRGFKPHLTRYRP
jgi:hypothetical protein